MTFQTRHLSSQNARAMAYSQMRTTCDGTAEPSNAKPWEAALPPHHRLDHMSSFCAVAVSVFEHVQSNVLKMHQETGDRLDLAFG